MHKLLTKLQADYPHVTFRSGAVFSWSPKDNAVVYVDEPAETAHPIWALLHEAGHALLEHKTYATDFELVKLEAAAWAKAEELAASYGHQIDPDHIQDCLDTYRDWLHQRSTCPRCLTTSLQHTKTTYSCYNCDAQWRVSRSKLCRPYRRLQTEVA